MNFETFQIPFYRLDSYIKWRLEQCLARRSTHPYNAGTYSDSGEIEALEDIQKLLSLYGKDFQTPAQQVANKKLAAKKPTYNPARDKCNGDEFWIGSYQEVMTEFGVQTKRPKNETIKPL